jgi:hypothetical protein
MRHAAALTIASALASCVVIPRAATVSFKPQTLDELAAYADSDRAIFAARCDKVAAVERGSRRARALVDVHVIAGDAALVGKSLQLTRFAQGDPEVQAGRVYLFAAYKGEWLPAWNWVEALPIDEASASDNVRQAQNALQQRRKPEED